VTLPNRAVPNRAAPNGALPNGALPNDAVVQRLHAAREPEFRLFLFHHAGGSAATFRPWQHCFPARWDVCTVGLPGRGRLHDVAPLADCAALVDFLLPAIQPWCAGLPFGFFGHSMGGLVAYELTRALLAAGGPVPSWLGVSGCGPPRLQQVHRTDAGPMTDAQLRQWLTDYSDTPAELLASDELWQLFGPMFRADFALVDSWQPVPDLPPLPVPIAAFGGSRDPLVAAEALPLWAEQTEFFQGPHIYPGGHFYLSSRPQQIARQIMLCILFMVKGIPAVS
jgi:surfactin synthase thioesterase subunit